MAEPPDDEMDDWPCPQLSPHPSGRVTRATILIDWAMGDWLEERETRQRVVDYTCSCRLVVYELLSGGGTCVFRRTHQTMPPRVAYAGPWGWAQAHRLWRLLLQGEAR